MVQVVIPGDDEDDDEREYPAIQEISLQDDVKLEDGREDKLDTLRGDKTPTTAHTSGGFAL